MYTRGSKRLYKFQLQHVSTYALLPPQKTRTFASM